MRSIGTSVAVPRPPATANCTACLTGCRLKPRADFRSEIRPFHGPHLDWNQFSINKSPYGLLQDDELGR